MRQHLKGLWREGSNGHAWGLSGTGTINPTTQYIRPVHNHWGLQPTGTVCKGRWEIFAQKNHLMIYLVHIYL